MRRSFLFNSFIALALSMSMLPVTAMAQNLPPINDNSGSFQTYPPANTGSYQQPYNNYQQQPNNYNYNQPQSGYGYNQPPLQGHVVSAPAGTFVTASFSQPVSSEFARVGDRFSATLGSPIAGSDGSIILPAGSQLEAQVVMVNDAGRTGKHGELDIRFTSARLPNGQTVPLSARIQTEDGTGVIKGGSTKGRVGRAALNTAVGAGLGAALGTALGPLSGGKVGRGAIYGTAIGGGAGAAKALWNKGEEAVLEAGQPLNIVLDQPLTVSPSSYSAPQQQYNNYQQPYGQPQYNNNYGGQPYNNYNYGGGY